MLPSAPSMAFPSATKRPAPTPHSWKQAGVFLKGFPFRIAMVWAVFVACIFLKVSRFLLKTPYIHPIVVQTLWVMDVHHERPFLLLPGQIGQVLVGFLGSPPQTRVLQWPFPPSPTWSMSVAGNDKQLLKMWSVYQNLPGIVSRINSTWVNITQSSRISWNNEIRRCKNLLINLCPLLSVQDCSVQGIFFSTACLKLIFFWYKCRLSFFLAAIFLCKWLV